MFKSSLLLNTIWRGKIWGRAFFSPGWGFPRGSLWITVGNRILDWLDPLFYLSQQLGSSNVLINRPA